MDYYIGKICDATQPMTFIRVFAILILADKEMTIFEFVDNGICDQELPVTGGRSLAPLSQSFDCIKTWGRLQQEAFDKWLWRIDVPFLTDGQDIIKFHRRAVLPFITRSTEQSNGLEDSDYSRVEPYMPGTGGYGEVSIVEIHPKCHNFQCRPGLQLHRPEGPFALKKLHPTRNRDIEKDFMNEVKMLRTFNGNVHPHIVTVLMAFKHGDRCCFLFPWADCDLLTYFETKTMPDMNITNFHWVAEQTLNITEAVHHIHFPPGVDSLSPDMKLYGRHGDIKAENILVFNEKNNPLLVLSDFGLGSMHHDWSKSMVPNRQIQATPGFRPPECDMENGHISRAFDVWTLGCVFLDILIWLLGGETLRRSFESDRMAASHPQGLQTPTYFEVIQTDNGRFGFIIKEQVNKWFAELHRHDRCTDFVHEFLELIQQRMLIVETQSEKRARTHDLVASLKTLRDKALRDERYCLGANPYDRPSNVPTIAEGMLSEHAKRHITASHAIPRTVSGPTQLAEQTFEEGDVLIRDLRDRRDRRI
ncbi:kinase-like domain-containing protein [Annulohypoxylon truncatum]|uniref:kinase-like domain-containing protein n=1 Tax=Annulohypoxylon truncatum TaxID=327061 RepID=UPI002008DF26|nr:kinase-like domain-containing protein [Annulohypoxylon truncatum]KAI1214229.1 kinase-like domain-containing protein [Annulohypoxylon truncatum]